MNLVDTSVYAYISECTTYDDALRKLDDAYIKRVNEVYARYKLSTCRQIVGESLEEYLHRLKVLSTDCNFRDFTAAQYQEAAIRDEFIAGLHSSHIHQRLLEGNDLQLTTMHDKARMLDDAQRNAGAYTSTNVSSVAPVSPSGGAEVESKPRSRGDTCSYCGTVITIAVTVLLETRFAINVVKKEIFHVLVGLNCTQS